MGFTIILAMMARTQQRIEAFIWVVCLSIGNFVIMGAIKTVLSGGGVVYSLAPSPRDPNVVWAGTDDGLVRVTRDGAKSWADVTPPGITPWSHISGIEASHFDARTAYVAIDRHRLDDERPYLYVTHDAGHTWRAATSGIPDGSFVNAVREDPVRPGLIYAATETGVYVSFDDGSSWQSLRLNMPVVSVRDIDVHGSDLAIATHGRAFWILDDVEPLRELAGDASLRARTHRTARSSITSCPRRRRAS